MTGHTCTWSASVPGACAHELNPAEGCGRLRLARVWRQCGERHLTWSNSSEILCGLPSLECQHVSGQPSNIFSLPYCLPVEELTWGVYHTCQHLHRRSRGDEPPMRISAQSVRQLTFDLGFCAVGQWDRGHARAVCHEFFFASTTLTVLQTTGIYLEAMANIPPGGLAVAMLLAAAASSSALPSVCPDGSPARAQCGAFLLPQEGLELQEQRLLVGLVVRRIPRGQLHQLLHTGPMEAAGALRGGSSRDPSAGRALLPSLFPAVTVAAGALLLGFETWIITDALLSITPAFGLDAQPAALGLEATTATMGSLCGTLTACRENWQVVGAVCGILWLWDVWRCANKDRLC